MKFKIKRILVNKQITEIDEEWLDLILEAKQIGLTISEIRAFFRASYKRN
ncbi:anti-repressor SinI family protein [Ectobacillus polymachus]